MVVRLTTSNQNSKGLTSALEKRDNARKTSQPPAKRMNIKEASQSNVSSGGSVRISSGTQLPTLPTHSYASEITKLVTDATNSILSLREKQLEYAERAGNSADPRQQQKLNNEATEIEAEISRITSETKVGDTNLLTEGATLTIESTNLAVGIGGLSGALDQLNLDLTSQVTAKSAQATLETAISSAKLARNSAESADTKLAAAVEIKRNIPLTETVNSSTDSQATSPLSPAQEAVISETELLRNEIVDQPLAAKLVATVSQSPDDEQGLGLKEEDDEQKIVAESDEDKPQKTSKASVLKQAIESK